MMKKQFGSSETAKTQATETSKSANAATLSEPVVGKKHGVIAQGEMVSYGVEKQSGAAENADKDAGWDQEFTEDKFDGQFEPYMKRLAPESVGVVEEPAYFGLPR